MSDRPRYFPFLHWDDDDIPAPVDDALHPETWPDVEWSTEQDHAGEFGAYTAFGDPND